MEVSWTISSHQTSVCYCQQLLLSSDQHPLQSALQTEEHPLQSEGGAGERMKLIYERSNLGSKGKRFRFKF